MPSLRTIRAKKQELLASAAHYDELAAKSRADAAEFEAAERVWLKLFGGSEDSKENVDLFLEEVGAGHDDNPEPPRKPVGLPPVPAMIIEALQTAAAEGKPGLNPQAMLLFVREKYWPSAGSSDIGSTAWRMWKDKRLAKPDENSSIYTLARAKEEAA